MYHIYDPDEWETFVQTKDYGRDPFGNPIGWTSCGQRRRPLEEVAKIKAEKERQHEDAILAEADAIRARRLSR